MAFSTHFSQTLNRKPHRMWTEGSNVKGFWRVGGGIGLGALNSRTFGGFRT